AGTIQDVSIGSLQPQSGDPVELLAVGPFTQINPGDSVSVDFALVGGEGLDDPTEIQEHARFAQRAFDRGYKIPTPPPSPRFKVVSRNQALDLYWDKSPESVADSTGPVPLDFEGYRVYLSEDRGRVERRQALVAQLDVATPPHDTTGFNTGFAAVAHDTLIDGQHYDYRLTVPALKNGFKYYAAVTSYDLGNVEIE